MEEVVGMGVGVVGMLETVETVVGMAVAVHFQTVVGMEVQMVEAMETTCQTVMATVGTAIRGQTEHTTHIKASSIYVMLYIKASPETISYLFIVG
jgi:hypothetical protein